MTARFALLRWVVRVVRREWREHVLVVSMIAFGIAIATLVVSVGDRGQEPTESFFYNAPSGVRVSNETAWTPNPQPEVDKELRLATAAALAKHGDVEVVVRGSFTREDVRLIATDPTTPLVRNSFELLEGRWPDDGEVALTTKARDELNFALDRNVVVGDTVPLDSSRFSVVGIYENPYDLADRAALTTSASLSVWFGVHALFPSVGHPATETFLAIAPQTDEPTISAYVDSSSQFTSGSGTTAAAYLVGTILCFQVAILASAGFTVLAQRRTRQFGMLSAIGASPRSLGSVMRLIGVVCGLLGGLLGLTVGVLLTVASTPLIQPVVNHRLVAWEIPWLVLLPMLPLAVLTAVAAAWWPARRIRNASGVDALSAHRPSNPGLLRPTLAAAVLLPLGGWLLKVGAPKNSVFYVVLGAAAIVLGGLTAAPAVVAGLARLASRAPLPIRVALRDLNRNRSRSVSAVAAAAIALAVPFGIASFMASLSQGYIPSFPDNVAEVYETSRSSFEGGVGVEEGPAMFESALEVLDGATLVPVQMPIDRSVSEDLSQGPEFDDSFTYPFEVELLRESGTENVRVAYLTPELQELMKLDDPPAGTHLIATVNTPIRVPGLPNPKIDRQSQIGYNLPTILIVGDLPGISRQDVVAGRWLVVNNGAFTAMERDAMRRFGLNSPELRFDSSFEKPPFLALRSGILLAGGLLGLSVVAIAVALSRLESAADTRSLNAMGARPAISRAIGASAAAVMVFAAGVIAVPTALVALTGVYLNPDESFDFAMPWMELGVLGIALPLVAGLGAFALTSTRTDHLIR